MTCDVISGWPLTASAAVCLTVPVERVCPALTPACVCQSAEWPDDGEPERYQPPPPQHNPSNTSSPTRPDSGGTLEQNERPAAPGVRRAECAGDSSAGSAKERGRDRRDGDQEESFGRNVGYQLKELDRRQKIIAQKLISDVLYHAKLGALTEATGLGAAAPLARSPNDT
ncbi:hypothetical protein EVAR_58186_1 [Eumeta japonica]|uniref:Uncharacterized protein n=1 Tax=Eumeta variegata TaxID=151549 RepID=A0A4C1YQ55_EUMVA|nr:hypothetical protein EVAR_58186_1 [Eumeta japonica]